MQGYTIFTIVITLLVVTLAGAAPQPKRKSKGVAISLTRRNSSILLHSNNTSVNLAEVEAHVASVSAKIVRGLNNYEKNTGTTHPSVLERERPNGDLVLEKYNNLLWHATLSIGSPPEVFDVELDTGCADLFILAVDEDGITPEGTVWDPSLSKTANDLNRQFKLWFANKDRASGKQYTDTVTVAGITADKQTIGAATTFIFMGTSTPPVDGILGLALQPISRFPASSLFETLIRENKVTDPMFSVQLSSSGGELLIGGMNEALFHKDTLTYADVTQPGYWQIKMDSIQADGQMITSNVDVIIDTGANFIFGDSVEVRNLHQVFGGRHLASGYYSLPCLADPEPSVTLKFGGRPFKIPIETLRLGPVAVGSSECFSTIVAQTAPVSFWSIGGPFLQSVYTVFDYGTGLHPAIPRVGFAELA